MTRWARGGEANRKKPLDASDWSELKAQKVDEKKLDRGPAHKSSESSDVRRKQKMKKKSSEVTDDSSQKPAEQHASTSGATTKAENIVAELELLGRKSALTGETVEKVELEEFVRKDRRREARRLKRQDTTQRNRVCFNCRQRGHDLASCPEVVGDVDQGTGVCFKCGSTEHKIHQCKVKVAHGQFPFAKCFICGEVGHLSRSCPDNPRGLYPNGGACNNCGSVEHFKKDCPELQQKIGEVETTLTTLDSRTKVDVEPALERTRSSAPPTKKMKIVKF